MSRPKLVARCAAAAFATAVALVGCTSDPLVSDPTEPGRVDNRDLQGNGALVQTAAAPHVATTRGGTYRVSWRSLPDPIPENEPFKLLVQVEHTDGSKPPPDLGIGAGAWMPAHKHGMLREPVVTRLEGGRFEVDGMLLHMGGEWKLTFDVVRPEKIEQAEFAIALLPPLASQALDGFDPDEVGRILSMSPLPPPPDDPTNAYDMDEAAARLGQYLFFDPRLSAGGELSCASCHVPELDWTDGKGLADVGTPLQRHTISLWNAAFGRWFFWDGRADSLWAQALQPLENAREQAADRLSIARLLSEDAELRRGYVEVFGDLPVLSDPRRFPTRAKPVPESHDDPLSVAWGTMSPADQDAVNRVFANVGKAIAAFGRKIVSRSSPFDDFVAGLRAGDPGRIGAFPPEALRGLKLFIGKANCRFCHSGPNFSDREFHHTPVPVRPEVPLDLGRFRGLIAVGKDPFNGVGPYSDGQDQDTRDKLEKTPVRGEVWGEFKTPTLRNVARTAPYMHQGQVPTLADVIDFYSDRIPPPSFHDEREVVLVPLHLSAQEKVDLVSFLESLSGDPVSEEMRRPPATPYVER